MSEKQQSVRWRLFKVTNAPTGASAYTDEMREADGNNLKPGAEGGKGKPIFNALPREGSDLDAGAVASTSRGSAKATNPGDMKRVQAPAPKSTAELIEAAVAATGIQGMVKDVNSLRSLPGCAEQPPHHDENPQAVAAARAEGLPVPKFVVMAHQPGTTFVAYHPDTGKRIELGIPPDHFAVVDADVVHSGAAWGAENTEPNDRTHAYIDVDSVKRKGDSTYYVGSPCSTDPEAEVADLSAAPVYGEVMTYQQRGQLEHPGAVVQLKQRPVWLPLPLWRRGCQWFRELDTEVVRWRQRQYLDVVLGVPAQGEPSAGIATRVDGIEYAIVGSEALMHKVARRYLPVVHDLNDDRVGHRRPLGGGETAPHLDYDTLAERLEGADVGVFAFREGMLVGLTYAHHELDDTVTQRVYVWDYALKAESEAANKDMVPRMANTILAQCHAHAGPQSAGGLEPVLRVVATTEESMQRYMSFGFEFVKKVEDGWQMERTIEKPGYACELEFLPPVVVVAKQGEDTHCAMWALHNGLQKALCTHDDVAAVVKQGGSYGANGVWNAFNGPDHEQPDYDLANGKPTNLSSEVLVALVNSIEGLVAYRLLANSDEQCKLLVALLCEGLSAEGRPDGERVEAALVHKPAPRGAVQHWSALRRGRWPGCDDSLYDVDSLKESPSELDGVGAAALVKNRASFVLVVARTSDSQATRARIAVAMKETQTPPSAGGQRPKLVEGVGEVATVEDAEKDAEEEAAVKAAEEAEAEAVAMAETAEAAAVADAVEAEEAWAAGVVATGEASAADSTNTAAEPGASTTPAVAAPPRPSRPLRAVSDPSGNRYEPSAGPLYGDGPP